ncbi:hypothetical protein G647_05250 [Cladophialophora carrionii CBS 160.54]|uniref:Vacuolar protein sorting-associated protein 62 n=1 Tax=Cladophialophora carrionii CBS 160.54 TaxID=1279043 RepID=V9DAX7_9EURO|nr:uncharacterized protein G647_05250 [Cladophialophora carrionii CBS 160.54]ETI23448.1 hypothetical protein G647_05250 [Cladophialophora carrionii CBS 160.54]
MSSSSNSSSFYMGESLTEQQYLAPIVYLQSKEEYLPSDIGSQLKHTHPVFKGSPIANCPSPLTLDNLDELNAHGGKDVFLSSNDDVSNNPGWMKGVRPDANGKTNGAKSCCIVVNDHGTGTVDAFYMYFYAYNQGQTIFAKELGDHVGDWEHNMIRFKDGKPTAIWYSQHASGEALYYKLVEKHNHGLRPITYSARGTHANYATAGTHDHAIPHFNLPLGVLMDVCDRGTLWDPTLNAFFYKYVPKVPGRDSEGGTFTPYEPGTPVAWLRFLGHWGDERFPAGDPRQREKNIGKHFKYEGGPTGPYDKVLERKDIWPKGSAGEHIWKIMPWA